METPPAALRAQAQQFGSPSFVASPQGWAYLPPLSSRALRKPWLERRPGQSELKRESRLGPAQVGHPPGKLRARPAPAGQTAASPAALALGSPNSAGGHGSRVQTRAGIRYRSSGARARRVGKKKTFRLAEKGRADPGCAAGFLSDPRARTLCHCRKPTRPAQSTSRLRPPIPRAEATHWLWSFISSSASLFPVGRTTSPPPPPQVHVSQPLSN